MGITNLLYKLARLSADMKALSSGSAKKVGRRVKNKATGRALGKMGVWRRLWK